MRSHLVAAMISHAEMCPGHMRCSVSHDSMWWCVRSGARWYSVSKKVSEVGKAGGNVGESDRWVLGKYVSKLESKQASKRVSN